MDLKSQSSQEMDMDSDRHQTEWTESELVQKTWAKQVKWVQQKISSG
jgi:hypothetical protein